ncbi:MAG TPA: RES family NAD+ phosphorylase, partial [Zeimonas sp.]|nr:RES family NAD+ phosphorylase [Zeimonas sp.]
GSIGIVYPSVRRPEGTNLACFRPAVVGNVRRGEGWRLTWSGSREPEIRREPQPRGTRAR